jgi:hypothetical protein
MVSNIRLTVLISLIVALGAVNCVTTAGDETVDVQECLRKALDAATSIDNRQLQEETLRDIGLAQVCAGDLAAGRRTIQGSKDAETAASVLAAIGLAQAKAKDAAARATLAEARRFAERVSHPRARELLLHAILTAHAAAGQDAEAAQIAQSFPDRLDQAYGFLAIAQAQIAQGRREQARATVAKAAGANRRTLDVFDMSAWEQILPMYLQLGQVAEAAKLANAISKGSYWRCNALCALARHEAKAGRASAETFAEAFQAARDIEDREPCRKIHLAAVVQDVIDVGDLEGAMKWAQLVPDSDSKAILLGAIAGSKAKAGDRTAARTILQQALHIAEHEKDGCQRVDALASLAVRQAAMGDRAAADATLAKALEAGKIESAGFDYAQAVTRVAEAQVKMGDRTSAEKTLLEASRHARAVSVAKDRADEAREIAAGQIAAGLPVAAQATLRDVLLPALPLDKSPRDGYQEAALLLAKAGDFAAGYAVARKIREPGPQSWAVRTVAFHQALAQGAGGAMAAAKDSNPRLQSAAYLGAALGLLNRRGIEVRSHYGVLLIDE